MKPVPPRLPLCPRRRLTRGRADEIVVVAAAAAGLAGLVTPAAGHVAVVGLVAAVSARRLRGDCGARISPSRSC